MTASKLTWKRSNHFSFLEQFTPLECAFQDMLLLRKLQLAGLMEQAVGREASWLTRSYPVLGILAPALTSHEGKIEYPGDPMCLYSALSWTIDQVAKSKHEGLSFKSPYNDLCPRLADLPPPEYRARASDSGIREVSGPLLNTDQAIFDPRVWNPDIEHYFANLLQAIRPRVILISTTSPAHRYAIQIARVVRSHDPTSLIVFGGRHIDETMRYQDDTHTLELAHSNTLRAVADGRSEPIVDFLVSGDGYFALDLLMKAISIAMDLEDKTASVGDVVYVLDQLAAVAGPVPGQAVITAVDGDHLHIFPLRGRPLDMAKLPPPYRPFAIRARFPIFQSPDGTIQRTAHMTTSNACPFQCNYCSESVASVGRLLKFSETPVQTALDQISEYVSYGAEALFFDDSVFWAGDIDRMYDFCIALAAVKSKAMAGKGEFHWLQEAADLQRLARLQWGAQLTFEFVATLKSESTTLKILNAMKDAGCTYIYFGLESMAPSIMAKIHKNLHGKHDISWQHKARTALELLKKVGIRAGVSVLFGLDGETRETIEVTVEAVARLIQDGLIYITSPNICTYHPVTKLTRLHNMESQLDYVTPNVTAGPPYVYFEEAFPGVVSKELTEEDIWYIHFQTQERWGQSRNVNPMQPTVIPAVPAWATLSGQSMAELDCNQPVTTGTGKMCYSLVHEAMP
jgi:radical SAM superfamily enzyme YgiQ (UPF0313 family)